MSNNKAIEYHRQAENPFGITASAVPKEKWAGLNNPRLKAWDLSA